MWFSSSLAEEFSFGTRTAALPPSRSIRPRRPVRSIRPRRVRQHKQYASWTRRGNPTPTPPRPPVVDNCLLRRRSTTGV